jgi:hypothetical protein
MMSIREEVESGMVERFHIVARPYEIKDHRTGGWSEW